MSRKKKKTLNVSFGCTPSMAHTLRALSERPNLFLADLSRRTAQQGCCGWGISKLFALRHGWRLETLLKSDRKLEGVLMTNKREN